MNRSSLFVLLIMALSLGSCSTQTFIGDSKTVGRKALERSDHFFFWGIGQEKMHHIEQVCGSRENLAKIKVKYSFLNGILTGLTYGLYSPRTTEIYCTQ